jgi:hypothetical protein
MKDKTLKLALEALEKCKAALAEELGAWDIDPPLFHLQEAHDLCGPVITAIRAALKAPVQEPVAWWIPKTEQFCLQSPSGKRPFAKAWEPLYATPPAQRQWVGLTDDDIWEVFKKYDSMQYREFSKAIEQALKEKNND